MRVTLLFGLGVLFFATSTLAAPPAKRTVSRICVHKSTSKVVVRPRCRKSEAALTDLAAISTVLGIGGDFGSSPSPTPSPDPTESPTSTPALITSVTQTFTGPVLPQGLRQVTALCPANSAAIGGTCTGSGGLSIAPPQDDSDLEGRSFSCRWRNPSTASINSNITTKALCASLE